MGRFTLDGGEAEKDIERQLKVVTDEICKEIKDVESVLIYGGFGRGEGSVKKANNRYYPANDFDVYAITRKKADDDVLDEIARRVAEKLGSKGIPFKRFDKDWSFENNFYLDLKCLTLDELRRLFPMLRYYELRNASNVIYGNDVRNLIPDYKIDEIPIGEGIRILLNRMTHLVEYFSLNGKHNDVVLSFFCAKAYIDSCTALSFLSKRYFPSYKKRMEDFYANYEKDFPDLYEKLPDLNEKVKKYTLWKLNFNGEMPEKDAIKFWLQTRKDFIGVVKYFFSRFLNRKIETTEELSNAIINLGKDYYFPYAKYYLKNNFGINSYFLSEIARKLIPLRFKYLYFLRILKEKKIYPKIFLNKRSPDTIIFGSVPFILFAIDDNMRLVKENFDNGLGTLRKVYPTNAKNWEELSQDYADAYVLFYLMKIV